MNTTKDRAYSVMLRREDFRAMPITDQERYINGMIGSRSNLLSVFSRDPNFQALPEQDRYKFLRGLAPEYFDVGEIDTAIEAPRIEPATEPSRVDSLGQTIAEGLTTLNEYTPYNLLRKAAGVYPTDEISKEEQRRATELAGAGISKVIGTAGKQAAGFAQLVHDYQPDVLARRVAEHLRENKDPDADVAEAYMQSSFAALRNAAQKEFDAPDPVLNKMGGLQRTGFDVAVAVAESVPAIAAMLTTGSWIPMLGAGLAAYSDTYGETRAARYTPEESAVISTPTAAATGLAMGFNAKMALNISKPIFQRIAFNTLADLGTGFSIPMFKFGMNYLVDNFYKTYQNDLQTPGMDFNQAFKSSIYNAFVNAASGQFLTLAPEIMRSAKMEVNGLKATETPSGEVVVHPTEYTPFVEDIIQRKEFVEGDAQGYVDRNIRMFEQARNHRQRRLDIEQSINEIPLAEIIDADPQAGPAKQAGRLNVGQKVGVSPEYFVTRDNKPRNMEAPAEVIRRTYSVEGVSRRGTPKKNYLVDVRLESGEVIEGLPRKWVVTKAKEGGAAPRESAKLVDFVSELLYPNLPISEITHEQARLMTGGLMGIVEQIGKRGRLAQIRDNYGAMVFDAARNNPEHAIRIFSHDIGHWLYRMDKKALADLGIPEFEGLQSWVETQIAKTAANQPTLDDFNNYLASLTKTERDRITSSNKLLDQAAADWWLNKEYGPELKQLWDSWALHPLKNPNGDELMANALSVFLNEAAGGSGVPGLKQMKVYADFLSWVDANEPVGMAIDRLSNQANFTGPRAMNDLLDRHFYTADRIAAEAERRNLDTDKTWLGALEDNFQNRFGAMIRQSKRNPLVIDRIDKSLMVGARIDRYIQDSYGETYRQLKDAGVKPEDYRNRVYANRVLKDRTKHVETLRPSSVLKDYDQYNLLAEMMRKEIREDAVDLHPEWNGEQLDKHVDAMMQEFVNDNIFIEHIDLQNPLGFTREEANAILNEHAATYTPEQIDLMNQRMKLEQRAFNDWVLPVLEYSGEYTSRQIAHMRDNEDYATFNVVHHMLKERKRGQSKPGTVGYFREQEGTRAMIDDPWARTVETRARMAIAAEKAGVTRDIMEMVAELEQANPDRKAVFEGDVAPDLSYDVIPTQKYDPQLGRMVKKNYVVKKHLIEPFIKAAETSPFWNWGSAVQGKLKGYMTIYNPKFWFRNFARDVIRTAINMPDVAALWEIPVMSINELVRDVKYQRKGKENPLRRKLAQMDIVPESVSSYATHEAGLTVTEKLKLRSGIEPDPITLDQTIQNIKDRVSLPTEPLDKAWASLGELANYAKSQAGRVLNPLKRFSLKYGGSVEFSTKVAAYKYLKKHYPDMPVHDRNWFIRNAVGTPMLNKKGEYNQWMSNLLLFYNPNVQGMVGDYGAFTRDPYANVFKRLAFIAPYMAATSLALGGFLGKDMKEWAENMPRRSWSRGINIPMGFTAEGESVAIQAPVDPLSSLMLSMAYDVVNSAHEGRVELSTTLSNFLNDGSENLPSVSPMLTAPMGVLEILGTGNTTEFSGRQAVDPSIERGGNFLAKSAYTMLYVLNQGWGGPLNAMGITNLARWSLDSKFPKYQAEGESRSRSMSFWQTIKAASKIPGLHTIGGLIKFNSGGVGERIAARANMEQRAYEDKKFHINQSLQRFMRGGVDFTKDELKDLLDPQFQDHIERTLTREETLKQITAQRPELAELMRQYFYNPNKLEKEQIFLMMLER